MKLYLISLLLLGCVCVQAQEKCGNCHLNNVQISATHVSVKDFSGLDCASCHTGKETVVFNYLHKPHLDKIPCAVCHVEREGKVNLISGKGTLVSKDDFELYEDLIRSADGSTAKLHLSRGVNCLACHKQLPTEGDQVGKDTCLTCHGSYEELARKTRDDKFVGNPHESHQGSLECSRCHKGHTSAKSYCMECHSNFKHSMPELK